VRQRGAKRTGLLGRQRARRGRSGAPGGLREPRGTANAPGSPSGRGGERERHARGDALSALLGEDGLPAPGAPRVDAQALAALLGEVVARQPAPPRAYLLPSPAARRPPPERLFQPRTLARSAVRRAGRPVVLDLARTLCTLCHAAELRAHAIRRALPQRNPTISAAQALAARARPTRQPVHETLFHVAGAMAARRREAAAAAQAAAMAECPFRPAHLAAHVARRGRALAAAAEPRPRPPLAPAGQLQPVGGEAQVRPDRTGSISPAVLVRTCHARMRSRPTRLGDLVPWRWRR